MSIYIDNECIYSSFLFYWIISFTFKFFLMFIFETERVWVGEGQREREGDTEWKQAPGSEVLAQSPMRGSNPQTVRSWPEPKSDA